MALIGKIREKSTLLVIFVGLGLLLFIVPFDRISSYFYGTGEQPIGSIEGAPMMESDWHYNYKIDSTINVYRQQYMQSGQVLVLDDQQNEQIKNNVWSQLVVGALFGKQLSEVPLSVGSKELNEIMIYGDEPSQVIKEMFTYDGNFAKDSVKPGIDRVLVGGKGAKAWLYSNVEKPIRSQRLRDKYTKMAKFGAYATTQDAKRKYLAANTKASIRYAFKEFSTIPDSVVKVEDNDIRTYFDAHKNEKKWKQETEVRTIDYVSFKISPSEEDKQRAMASMERKKQAFEKSVNDSLFVANNAATPIGANQQQQNQFQINSVDVLPTEPYKPGSGTFSVATDELITAAAKGDVVGPVSEGNKLQLIKVRDVVTKNEVTVRHILIKADEADADQYKKKKAFADSLLRVLRADRSKFVDFVYKYSEDPGSNQPGKDGEYTFDKEINFVQEYKDFGFNKPVGTMEIVKTSFGFHIMENLRRGDNEYKMIAIVDANVKPSKVTRDLAYTEVVDGFYAKSKELGFEKAAEELNKEVKTAENVRIESPFIGELGKNMPLIKWNFNHEVGSISDPEFVSDELLAITSLKSEAHEGAPSFEGTKELMKPYVLKEKKAAYLLTKIGSATSVDDVAKAIDVTAETAEINLGMNNLPGIAGAKEPEVMGTIFATEGGTTTKPIQGYNGLYVVEVATKTAASVAENQDFSAEKGTLLGELRANVEAKLIESLAKAADFKDWRMKQQILNRD
jgi:parvulin-like peptidyl-prolyl isomerase